MAAPDALNLLMLYFDSDHAPFIVLTDEIMKKLKLSLYRTRIRTIFYSLYSKYFDNGFIGFARLADLCLEIFIQIGLFAIVIKPIYSPPSWSS